MLLQTVPRVLRRAALAAGLVLASVPALAQSEAVYVVQSGDTLFKIAQTHGLTVDQLKAYNGLTSNIISIGQPLRVAATDGGRIGWEGEEVAELPGTADPVIPEPPDALPLSEIEPLEDRPVVLETPAPIPAGPPPPPPPPAAMARVRIGRGARGEVTAPPLSASGGALAVHVVQAGETLYLISRRYGMTVDGLKARNALETNLLSVGQELIVSGEAAPPPAAAAPLPSTPYDLTESTVPDDRVHVTRRGETLYAVAARYGTTVADLLALNTLTTAPLPAGSVLALPDSSAERYYRAPAPIPPPDEAGLALVYPDSYRGRETISGEAYDPEALTASHRTLPFGTVVHVLLPARERAVLVRVNDRGPVSEGFLVELSEAAADALGQDRGAAERVELRVIR
ncbi:MAG: LysM peptidoglycan-binding domain-containing protein [Bacteroidota bacterium]